MRVHFLNQRLQASISSAAAVASIATAASFLACGGGHSSSSTTPPDTKVTVTVDPSGSIKTIQAAIQSLTDHRGATIHVKAGTYHEAVDINKSGASASDPIVLQADGTVTIDGTGLSGEAPLIQISGQSFIKVIGFKVTNLSGDGSVLPIGISVTGSGDSIEIRNNEVSNIINTAPPVTDGTYDGNAHGIAVYGNQATPISHLVIDGNQVHHCQTGWSESMTVNGNVTNFTVSNNVIHDNNNIGIDLIGFEGTAPQDDQARNGVCSGNHVFNITSAYNPAYGGDPITGGGDQAAAGIYVDGGRSILIEGNTVDHCDVGIECESEHAEGAAQDIVARNNLLSRSVLANLMAGGYNNSVGGAINITYVNNTTYQCENGEVVLQNHCDGIQIKNNIFVATPGQDYLQEWIDGDTSTNTNITVDTNLYFGAATDATGAWTDPHALFADPLLTAPVEDLHPSGTSPVINAGLDLGLDSTGNPVSGSQDRDGHARVQGGRIDLGAYEVK